MNLVTLWCPDHGKCKNHTLLNHESVMVLKLGHFLTTWKEWILSSFKNTWTVKTDNQMPFTYNNFIQNELQFRRDTTEQLKVMGHTQGPNRGSLVMLGYELTNVWSDTSDQCSPNHWATTARVCVCLNMMYTFLAQNCVHLHWSVQKSRQRL